jgi:hypothetical protein
MVAIRFEKSYVNLGGFWVELPRPSALREANAFSLWNNNLGHQGILELQILTIKGPILYLVEYLELDHFKLSLGLNFRVSKWKGFWGKMINNKIQCDYMKHI